MHIPAEAKSMQRSESSSHSSNLAHQKRKAPMDRGDPPDEQIENLKVDSSVPKGEYETGRVICEVCGEGVSFRDEATGGFTLKHWDAHREECATTTQAPPEPVIYTPENAADALTGPPAKRRRAKRTEEERIEYLRADPYVAQFEAYRVLCASCDKWIRLRPNSTYCSIPWDAHRKSCLSKKINNKNVYALDERNALFSKDQDIRKFDAERVLCNNCDSWIAVSLEDHLQAVKKWLQHRESCVRKGIVPVPPPVEAGLGNTSTNISTAKIEDVPPPTEQQLALASLPPLSRHAGHISSRKDTSSTSIPPSSPPSSFKDMTPTSFPATHESRRRNAEQRAATLRADPLVGEVEPNRVFCSLCSKWVQLRQDSSYCAYPWIQHRGKCLARHHRREQKGTEHKTGDTDDDEMMSADEDESMDQEPPESEEDVDGQTNQENSRRAGERQRGKIPAKEDTRSISHHPMKAGRLNAATSPHSLSWVGSEASAAVKKVSQTWRSGRSKAKQQETDGDTYLEDFQGSSLPSRLTRRLAITLADLNSHSGRTNFIFSSIAYLFTTTYENTDDMSISSLLSYLNSAMPADKHEDFDTAEVVKAAAVLQDRGDIVFEGDLIRLPD